MKGLCHVCFITNVIITIKNGKIMCGTCVDVEELPKL